MQKNIIVVGGGAAGLMAAVFAARHGANVRVIERNEKIGKKIYITGKGRCNVTNAADMEHFMQHILRNPRFLYASFANLDNAQTMAFFEKCGVPLKTERGDRVFPVSDHASDITKALQNEMRRLGVTVQLDSRVSGLLKSEGRVTGVLLENGASLHADAVILATGGLSYPTTGSTGDGLRFAEKAGHSIKKTLPSLVSIETEESWPGTLSGLSLKNVRLRAWQKGAKKEKCIFDEQGEMLFTHFGISGPLPLTLSGVLPEELGAVRMSLDLKPALDEQTLDARLLRDFKEYSRKQLVSVMDGLVPHNLGLQILVMCRISPSMPVNSVTAEQRAMIRKYLKDIPLTPHGLGGFNEAIVTRGGVDVREINASTMESKLMPGLYFAGEMMDVDATTGGFNLQIAFSTGALAGKSAAEA